MGKQNKARSPGLKVVRPDADGSKALAARRDDNSAHGGEETGPLGKIKKKFYEAKLAKLQIELVKLQEWIKHKGLKVVVIFEGRDAAGKGGVIKRITECMNPRVCRMVALATPTEREQTQWYFQRYVPHLPAAGEMVLFDRCWYNRAGVERVMGFCTDAEYQEFLRSCPEFERMLVRSGIILIKYWFSVSDEEQERRFRGRIARSDQALEALAHGPRIAASVGRVLQGQGRDVRPHRHQAGALARGRSRRQEARAAQLHQPSPEHDPLRGSHAASARTAAASGGGRLRSAPEGRSDLCARAVLTKILSPSRQHQGSTAKAEGNLIGPAQHSPSDPR